MPFYELSKGARLQKYADIQNDILYDLQQAVDSSIRNYFDDMDTYIRRAGYLAFGRLYRSNFAVRDNIIGLLDKLIGDESERVRQTVINSCGEIAIFDFPAVTHLFEIGLLDKHHCVRNAVQGSLKKSGEKNPASIIEFCKNHITNDNPEIRRQVAHGLELRGRTHPEDVMPILRLLQFEKHKRVRPMVIHILGQISYKKGCLEKVVEELVTWDDKALADDCFEAIIKQNRHANSHFSKAETLFPADCLAYINEAKRKIDT